MLLGGWGKDAGRADALLNLFLFMPLGFGIAERLRERGRSRLRALGAALLAGFLLSYSVEFSQIYIFPRDSGWEDVLTNSSGSCAGFLVYEIFGAWIVGVLSAWGRGVSSFLAGCLRGRLAWLGAVLVVLLYCGLWFGLSAYMQKQSGLSNWWPDCWLLVGNDAGGRPGTIWEGKIFQVQIWDRAIADAAAAELTSGALPAEARANLRAEYDFTSALPLHDQTGSLPDLVSISASAEEGALQVAPPEAQNNAAGLLLDGSSWLATKAIVPDLVLDMQRTNQFAVHVICTRNQALWSDSRILSISQSPARVDLQVRQEKSNLVLWFRNPMTPSRSQLAWYIPNVFASGQARNILVSYDGSDAKVFVDGSEYPRVYRLGPGTGFTHAFWTVKTSELDGYNEIYYALIFFPLGILLGFADGILNLRSAGRAVFHYMFLGIGVLVPAVSFELLLIAVSGRPARVGSIALSIFLTIAGALWIHCDNRPIPKSDGNFSGA